MNEPTTRPGALEKAKELANGDPYREKVLITLALLEERSEIQASRLDKIDNWTIDHDRQDEVRFARGEERMARIEEKAAPVTSSVNDLNNTKQQFEGMRKFVAGAIIISGAAYGVVKFIGELATWMTKP